MKKSLKTLLTLCFVVPFAFIAVACNGGGNKEFFAGTKLFQFKEYRLFGELIGEQEFCDAFCYDAFVGEWLREDDTAWLEIISEFETETGINYYDNIYMEYEMTMLSKWLFENKTDIIEKYETLWDSFLIEWNDDDGTEGNLSGILLVFELYQQITWEFNFDDGLITTYQEPVNFTINEDRLVSSDYPNEDYEFMGYFDDSNNFVWFFGFYGITMVLSA